MAPQQILQTMSNQAAWQALGREASCPVEGTTMMVRNLPRKYVAIDLLQELDHYLSREDLNFVSVPWDRVAPSNLGFAFVNFTSAASAQKLFNIDGQPWKNRSGIKRAAIVEAKLQGLGNNVLHSRDTIPPNVGAKHHPLVLSNGQFIGFEFAVSFFERNVPQPMSPSAVSEPGKHQARTLEHDFFEICSNCSDVSAKASDHSGSTRTAASGSPDLSPKHFSTRPFFVCEQDEDDEDAVGSQPSWTLPSPLRTHSEGGRGGRAHEMLQQQQQQELQQLQQLQQQLLLKQQLQQHLQQQQQQQQQQPPMPMPMPMQQPMQFVCDPMFPESAMVTAQAGRPFRPPPGLEMFGPAAERSNQETLPASALFKAQSEVFALLQQLAVPLSV